jgi:DNA-binding FadR family transcriptional regulator
MALSEVRTLRASEVVLAQLEGLIASGEWPVGSKIPAEPELVTRLGVGRNTVREAVRALEHAGLLEPRRGDGTYVRATSDLTAALARRARRNAVLDMLEVRAWLERDAAAAAALRRTDADLTAIRDTLARRQAAGSAADHSAFVAADLAFHAAVVAATGNEVLIELYGALTDALHQTVTTVAELSDGPAAIPGHVELADAIAARDPDAAGRAVASYLDAAHAIVSREPTL